MATITCIKCKRGAYELNDSIYCSHCNETETLCKCKPKKKRGVK